MSYVRLTKTNIDRDTLAGMQITAAAAGISTAQLIDMMYLTWLSVTEGQLDAKKA